MASGRPKTAATPDAAAVLAPGGQEHGRGAAWFTHKFVPARELGSVCQPELAAELRAISRDDAVLPAALGRSRAGAGGGGAGVVWERRPGHVVLRYGENHARCKKGAAIVR